MSNLKIRMKTKTITWAMTILLFVGLVSIATTTDFSNKAFAGTQIYNAQLSGDQELPPTQSTATGMAKLQIPLSAISSPQATVKYTDERDRHTKCYSSPYTYRKDGSKWRRNSHIVQG